MLAIFLQQKPFPQNDVRMYLAFLVEDEASLKGLDKIIAAAVDYDSFEEELMTATEYPCAHCFGTATSKHQMVAPTSSGRSIQPQP